MLPSNLVALLIVITTAATLNAHGVTDIESSAQAAEALRPITGRFAFVIFALGIVGTGLMALPVLAGSAAYALGEVRHWRVGMAQLPHRAKEFYLSIAIATAIGIAMNFTAIDPIKALYWSAVVNGVVAAPIMVMMMRMACRADIMGRFTLTKPLVVLGWIAIAVMGASVVVMGVTSLL